ncbi:MAG: PBP1A family penicillin-binding protein [Myxococcota bacterium]
MPARKKSARRSTGASRSTKSRSAAGRASGRGGGARASRPTARARFKRVARVAAVIAFVAGFAVATWLVRLDRVVVARFEGQRFKVPSKVMSAPTILYPGLDIELLDLVGTLERLGYRSHPEKGALPIGTYRARGSRWEVALHPFEHPSRPEPARRIGIQLRGTRIDVIRDLEKRRELGAVLLEPELVGAYYGPNREQRDLVRIADVPRHLVDAVVAVEDRRFEQHHGVDVRRVGGALIANLRAGRIREGGSTLTQQLVKNFFLTPERTLTRKIQEAVMALIVEARYDKQAILESYLNEIYLGQRGSTAVHGVGEAARLYFGKSVPSLTVGESALLAAIIQSPNRISPHRDLELATERRNLVLRLMRDQGRIDEATYRSERDEPLRVAVKASELSQSRYFLDVLRRQLPEVYDPELLRSEGLVIYSTLDPRLQRAAAGALSRGLERIEARRGELRSGDPTRRLQGCVVALRPQTGEIVALVGGRDYRHSQFDRCSQARRQLGSVFKPVVYVAALERGSGEGRDPAITLASFVDDSPIELETTDGVWRPKNFDGEFHGRVTVREAVERSLNVASVRLALEVGIDRVIDVGHRLGITSPLPAVPSLALGTAEVSPLEVARAYATIANGGARPVPHSFEDVVATGDQRVERRRIEIERVIDPGTAYLATSLLQGVVERGTAARVRAMGLRGPIAGKTGTTDDEQDLWFVGYTPELVAVVWVGFDEPRSIGLPSSQVALPIWVDFVREALGDRLRGAFLPPPDVRTVSIHPGTGALALSGCPEHRDEFFLEDTEPAATCPSDGATTGDRFLDWLRNWL